MELYKCVPLPLPSDATLDANSSPQYWLLGYEFPATLIILTLEKVYFVTTKKKGMAVSSFPRAHATSR